MRKNSIALIGFMATGKTSVGRILADQFGKGYKFIEMDDLIVEKAGKSIPEIFKDDGEIRFRELEMAVCKDVSKLKKVVISCGGGVVLNQTNVDRLRKSAIIVLLTASPETILERVSRTNKRPLLKVPNKLEKIKGILKERKSLYKSAADIIVETDTLSVEEVSERIIEEMYKQYSGSLS